MALGGLFRRKKKEEKDPAKADSTDELSAPVETDQEGAEEPYGPSLKPDSKPESEGELPPLPGIDPAPELPGIEPEQLGIDTPIEAPLPETSTPSVLPGMQQAQPIQQQQASAQTNLTEQKIELLNTKVDALKAQIESIDNKLAFIQRYIMGGR